MILGHGNCELNTISVKVENLTEFIRASPSIAESSDNINCKRCLAQFGVDGDDPTRGKVPLLWSG
jgi:hypothetical protein